MVGELSVRGRPARDAACGLHRCGCEPDSATSTPQDEYLEAGIMINIDKQRVSAVWKLEELNAEGGESPMAAANESVRATTEG